MTPPPTKSGTRKLSEVARKVVVPSGIVSTGWPSVRDLCVYKLGITFDPWQDGTGRIILAKRADGKLAVMIGGVGMSLPRQVGKTYLLAAIVFALCILNPGFLIIWSAHHGKTHGETFLAMQAFADRAKVKPYIRQVFTGSGDEEIRFLNGSRILFGARERGFGRGIPGVDVIIADEAQIMSDKALDAQLATMNTSKFGLAVFVGTPPRPDDPSEAFTRMRTEAWEGKLLDAAWIELGADPDASPSDRKQWARANPSYPHRTPVESILRLQRKLKEDSFLREGLGIWDGPGASALIDPARWLELTDTSPHDDKAAAFGIEISRDRSRAHVGAAVPRGHAMHVELVETRRGTGWLVERCIELGRSNPGSVFVVDASGPALKSFLDELEDAGLEVLLASTADVGQGCGQFIDAVDQGTLRHGPQPELDAAVAGVKKRDLGDGAFAFGRKASGGVDIGPLNAVMLAAWAAQTRSGGVILW
jgi:hypothetical protein